MAASTIDYSGPGPFTRLDADQLPLTKRLPITPVDICEIAQGLVIQPHDAASLPVPQERLAEKSLRGISDIIRSLTSLDPAPLDVPRPAHLRVVGTCRHFALLSCALLRLQGIPARARCGFATYFVPGKSVDHWITEYWHTDEHRWVRIDTEILGGQNLVAAPEDLADGEFLTGGEAWSLYRQGAADPDSFGVAGVAHAWGVGEIRGNAIRDLAALQKIEMLPWDEWGRMEASYQGATGPDYDSLMDAIATTCAADDPEAMARLYESEDLEVPTHMIR
ncbi:transglutaminase-like domain-containing protein [Nonomuraea guangzhouensis]|uniref:Transglutaminase-like domain-containing protein n=1 Tax=Nonomuraea guangzhouensis TaxID=1291555 RepID=A0ABW4FZG4_9ACTN|nr:transglutaminase domain-containing protein [Nonomuraea guangzhouensis]